MMNVWRAVRWWDEWQLRILVLGSLGLQWFLMLAAPMRKYTIPQLLRTCIWLAYISSDAVAIYALATLFNRHAKASNGAACNGGGGQAGVLEILWAPVLLIHLGGQRELTAYNIEDNELWLRHTVTLVSQVAVAIYAFYKSWPNSTDRRLWASAILLFIVGVLSFSEKPWAFNRARIQRLAAVSSVIQGTRKRRRWWEWCFTELDLDLKDMTDKCMCWCWRRKKRETEEEKRWKQQDRLYKNQVHMILSDMSLFAAHSELTRRGEDAFLNYLPYLDRAEYFSKKWLRRAFGLIYTRANVVWTPAYLAYHLLLVPAMHGAAIALFAVSHKRGRYNPTDVKTTYILLCFTATLDMMAPFIVELLHGVMTMAGVPSLCEWIAQYNLINAVLRRMQPTGWLIKCAGHIGLRENYFMCKRDELYNKVAGFLIVELLGSASESIVGLDLSTYRNLNADDSNYKNWALGSFLKNNAVAPNSEVWNSIKASFDRSVLLWHLATDLCLCLEPPTAPVSPREVRMEAISNYMAYLLYLRPDMLMTGSRQHLFTEAMDQVEAILKQPTGRHFVQHPVVQDDKLLVETLFRRTLDDHGCRHQYLQDTSTSTPPSQYPLVHDTCRLAQELLKMDKDKRLELMYRVWLGMLFYSASMCSGYLHAKSLGEGGEFLSFVWLLISVKGIKTLADKLQMPDQATIDDQDKDRPSIIDDPDKDRRSQRRKEKMMISDNEDWY